MLPSNTRPVSSPAALRVDEPGVAAGDVEVGEEVDRDLADRRVDVGPELLGGDGLEQRLRGR
jgi:hypothetical protein